MLTRIDCMSDRAVDCLLCGLRKGIEAVLYIDLELHCDGTVFRLWPSYRFDGGQ